MPYCLTRDGARVADCIRPCGIWLSPRDAAGASGWRDPIESRGSGAAQRTRSRPIRSAHRFGRCGETAGGNAPLPSRCPLKSVPAPPLRRGASMPCPQASANAPLETGPRPGRCQGVPCVSVPTPGTAPRLRVRRSAVAGRAKGFGGIARQRGVSQAAHRPNAHVSSRCSAATSCARRPRRRRSRAADRARARNVSTRIGLPALACAPPTPSGSSSAALSVARMRAAKPVGASAPGGLSVSGQRPGRVPRSRFALCPATVPGLGSAVTDPASARPSGQATFQASGPVTISCGTGSPCVSPNQNQGWYPQLADQALRRSLTIGPTRPKSICPV
jgi:hypothetical protein